MSSSSAGINSVIGNISTSTDTTLLPLNDPGCNDTTCHAFQEAMDASQAEIPFASQFIYGHYIVFSYCAVVLFFSIAHVYRHLSLPYQSNDDRYQNRNQNSRQTQRYGRRSKLYGGSSLTGMSVLDMETEYRLAKHCSSFRDQYL
ncbi:hypothetical protein WAI453_001549 [Rhynchosporium graminicola]